MKEIVNYFIDILNETIYMFYYLIKTNNNKKRKTVTPLHLQPRGKN